MTRPAPSSRSRSTGRVAGTVAEVQAVLSAPDSLTRWWPAVHTAVVPVADGRPDGVGRSVEIVATG